MTNPHDKRESYEALRQADQLKSDELRAAAKQAGESIPARIITEPIDDLFFFPTPADVKIARKWLDRDIVAPDDIWPLATALRLVAKRIAVPLRFLKIVRWLDKEEGQPVDRSVDVWAEAADKAYVDADNAKLDRE